MKKYSKLIGLLLIIVIVFSVFYVQNSMLSNSFAQFKIETIEGDEAIKDKLVIKGDLYASYNTGEAFKIAKDQIDYLRDSSFFDRLEEYYMPDKVKQLRDENRSFMRMKNHDGNSYLENGDTIIYASVPYTRWGILKGHLQIASYNRETKEERQIEIELPNLLEYAYIENMYIGENNLYVSLLNTTYDVEHGQEKIVLYVYAYDLENERVVDSHEIIMDDGSTYSNFTNVFVDDEKNPKEMIVTGTSLDYEALDLQEDVAFENANSREETVDNVEEIHEEEIVALQTIKKIDLETGEVSEVKVEKVQENSIPVAYNGKEIIFARIKGNKLLYTTYDIATAKLAEKLTVETDTNYISLWDLEGNIVKNNQIYTLVTNDVDHFATLIVVDTETVELSYQAKIEGELTQGAEKEDIETYFHTLEVLD